MPITVNFASYAGPTAGMDVTSICQQIVTSGQITFLANNTTFGRDPDPSTGKAFVILYNNSPAGPEMCRSGVEGQTIDLSLVPSAPKTVTFQQSFPTGCPSAAAVYTEFGLNFANTVGNKWCSPVNGFVSSAESPSHLIVTAGPGQVFEFQTIQICNASIDTPSQTIVFTGTRKDKSTVKQSRTTLANSTAPQTLATSGYINLVSLDISLGSVAFNNFVFIGPTS